MCAWLRWLPKVSQREDEGDGKGGPVGKAYPTLSTSAWLMTLGLHLFRFVLIYPQRSTRRGWLKSVYEHCTSMCVLVCTSTGYVRWMGIHAYISYIHTCIHAYIRTHTKPWERGR
ncbi:unnamed protein product [Tuber aestivum]|uniref:Uncharacterized protein n=1 Tax=Tuber aestivum TaxID=59557 RepID=A0A292Q625_9PEZI|nr:unnamed protein product [Tuber aestivum]